MFAGGVICSVNVLYMELTRELEHTIVQISYAHGRMAVFPSGEFFKSLAKLHYCMLAWSLLVDSFTFSIMWKQVTLIHWTGRLEHVTVYQDGGF